MDMMERSTWLALVASAYESYKTAATHLFPDHFLSEVERSPGSTASVVPVQ